MGGPRLGPVGLARTTAGCADENRQGEGEGEGQGEVAGGWPRAGAVAWVCHASKVHDAGHLQRLLTSYGEPQAGRTAVVGAGRHQSVVIKR